METFNFEELNDDGADLYLEDTSEPKKVKNFHKQILLKIAFENKNEFGLRLIKLVLGGKNHARLLDYR